VTGRLGRRRNQLLGDLKETRDWEGISDERRGKRRIPLLDEFKETRDWKGVSDGKTRRKTYSATK
jgi:hypothetical protein